MADDDIISIIEAKRPYLFNIFFLFGDNKDNPRN